MPLVLLSIVPVSQFPNVLDRLSDVIKLAVTRIVGSRMLIDSHHDDASPLHKRYNRAWHFLELASDCYCSRAPVAMFDRMANRPKDGHLRREWGDILVSLRQLPGGFLIFGDQRAREDAASARLTNALMNQPTDAGSPCPSPFGPPTLSARRRSAPAGRRDQHARKSSLPRSISPAFRDWRGSCPG